MLGCWVSFSSLCGHGSDGSHGAGVARVGGQAQNTPTAALLNVGISTSTPTSTYARRDNTISRKCCLKNYMNDISACIDTIRGMTDFTANSDLQQLHDVLRDAQTNPAV